MTFGEVWFDAPNNGESCDIIHYRQAFAPVPNARCSPKHTYEVDLTSEPEEIFSRVQADSRTKIRRAEKDGAVYQPIPPEQVVSCIPDMCESFDQMAHVKGLSPIDRAYVVACHEAGCLDISRVVLPSGEVAVWHSHIICQGRATLFTSVSHFRDQADPSQRNAVGRANRFAHWRDMCRFRSMGLVAYDFGGWYVGSSDEDLLKVNRFKREFGGSIVKRYNCTMARTVRGGVYLVVRSVADRAIGTPNGKKWLRRLAGLARGRR